MITKKTFFVVAMAMSILMPSVSIADGVAPELSKEVLVNETGGFITKTREKNIYIQALVLFEFDSADLSDKGKEILMNRIAKYKGKVSADIPVDVIGHTDSTGSEEYNQSLSERRAAAVAEFLRQNTYLGSNNINVEGYGELDPAMVNTTKLGRAGNRRVDIHFIGTRK